MTNVNTLLIQLVMDLKSGKMRQCEALGLSLEEIQTLNQLSIDDLYYLVNTSVSVLTLTINHTSLDIMLKQAHQEKMLSQRIERALVLGGSIDLMQHYFGLTATEVSSRRRLANVVVRQGRNYVPTEKEEITIWEQWIKTGIKTDIKSMSCLNALEAMMLIAEQLEISLTSIWILIKGWAEEKQRKAG